ncbi:MAG: outer membrane protein assembly factor BamA [Gammaproteobacteria bacterium]|nr:outer membrane protein assembly factor BamA [Gammaproteobacteria bacterium]
MKRTTVFAGLLAVLLSVAASAWEPFRVGDIRLLGLQRVSAGTVFNLLPLSVGDMIDSVTVRELVRELFASGYFDDVTMSRDDDILIVSVRERPSIESIEIDGNKAIKTESLMEALSGQGLREGEIFKQATLERVGLELERSYVAQGRYNATIETKADPLPRNRVAIEINIDEGSNSGIRHINVVGNTVFSQAELLADLELKHPSLFSFFRGDDKYSQKKLSGDLERVESYYQDRGHVDMTVRSAQVSITPDRKQVYVTVNIDEGELYTVNEVDLAGELRDVDPEVVKSLFLVANGQTFSRALMTATEERITAVLGNSGYTFASATGIPETRDDGTVNVTFYVEAGQRAYVRRLSFAGNSVTHDEVLRREMRQIEGGWASTAQIELSKVRLERLGYFEEVNVETPEVPGTDDQIDVDFSVKEQPTGVISGQLGYQEITGLHLGASYQQQNVAGTGNSIGISIGWNDFYKHVTGNFFDPYFTADGVSRGYSFYFRRSDYSGLNLARFSTDALGVGATFGFPISETQRIQFGVTVEQTEITEGLFAALEIADFIEREEGNFLNWKAEGSWLSSTLNRGLFPTAGRSQSVGLEVAIPGSELSFYKLQYAIDQYFRLPRGWSLRTRSEVGYGGVYGDTETFPFYEHFFAGGFGSVRGFERSSLGPRGTEPPTSTFIDPDGLPIGGNLLFEASAELIFPLPFLENRGQFRPVFFVDVGNVFNTDCPTPERLARVADVDPAQITVRCEDFSVDALRYSAGFSVTWLTGMGPMTFVLAKPFNAGPFDEEETFSFELGRTL